MLNDPLRIGSITVKNRIAIPPMVCFDWVGEDGLVSENHIAHYERLARGGAGLIIVEATAVTKEGRLHETELGLWEDGQIPGMKRIADAIHVGGAKAFIQLVHAGGNGVSDPAMAPSDMLYRENIRGREMTEGQMLSVRRAFVAAALRAKRAGFDGVELHGCHGYLISCFCSTVRNRRTDAYGQDRTLFARQTLADVRTACGPEYTVGIRLAAFEPRLEDGLRNAKAIAPLCDFLDISYGADCEAEKPEGFPCSAAVYGAQRVKQLVPDKPVFGVDGINSRQDVLNALSGGIDMVDCGRVSLVDPAFAEHILKDAPAGKCLHCRGKCAWNPGTGPDHAGKCPGRKLQEK